jgi:superfamily I DNA/RNA helicase
MYRFVSSISQELGYTSTLNVVGGGYYIGILHNLGTEKNIDGFDFKEAKKLFGRVNDNKSNNDLYANLNYDEQTIVDKAEKIIKNNNSITYMDMLYLGYQALLKNPKYKEKFDFEYIIIDEFQDTSNIQIKIIQELFNDNTKAVFCGDAKQNIYGFVNAKFEYADEMIRKYKSKIYYLSETFRFGQPIADFANKISNEFIGIDETYLKETVTSIKEGKEASFTILKENPFKIDPTKLKDIEIDGVVYKGKYINN